MQGIFKKRIIRELRKNKFRYFSLFILISVAVYAVISIIGAAQTVITRVEEYANISNVEDGQFTVFLPLQDEELEKIREHGYEIEENFYYDSIYSKAALRIYKNRDRINKINLDEGKLSEKSNEVVLEKQFAKEHNLRIGEKVSVSNMKLEIVGIGSSPDYDAPLKQASDVSINSSIFGSAFVTDEGYTQIQKLGTDIKSEEFVYSYVTDPSKVKEESWGEEELKEYLSNLEIKASQIGSEYLNIYGETKINNLVNFLTSSDNARISGSINNILIYKQAGIVAGVIVMILLAYVISVFVKYSIDQESTIIGALYALGIAKKQLLWSYILLPTLITMFAGIVGTLIGFSEFGVGIQLLETTSYYSVPTLSTDYAMYLIIYGMIMPAIICMITNCIVINRKLSLPVLSLMRKEQKDKKTSKLKLSNMNFIKVFQIRQFIREFRTSMIVVIGIFMSLLIAMLAVDIYVCCINLKVQNEQDVKFEYMYTFKYPYTDLVIQDEEMDIEYVIPNDGEAGYVKTFKNESLGYNLDVSLLGIGEDSSYFKGDNLRNRKNEVVISTSMADKYNLKKGDKFLLSDDINNIDYGFTVSDINAYSVGLYVFMDIDVMRELFDQDDGYYNTVFSKDKLDIDEGRLYGIVSRDDILESSDTFLNMLMALIIILGCASLLIFVIVMYLMVKVMIDGASFSISLTKVFGYQKKEISKLYLDGNFILVILSTIISIGLAKLIMDSIFPLFVANISSGFDLTFDIWLYPVIFVGTVILYYVIHRILMLQINRYSPAEVIKNRE